RDPPPHARERVAPAGPGGPRVAGGGQVVAHPAVGRARPPLGHRRVARIVPRVEAGHGREAGARLGRWGGRRGAPGGGPGGAAGGEEEHDDGERASGERRAGGGATAAWRPGGTGGERGQG